MRERFLAALADEPETYGWPCGHCGICDFRHLCWQQRVDDDHLSLVAGMRRVQAETLMDAGVSTLEALGDLEPETLDERLKPVAGASEDSFEAVRHQAELQLRGRREDRYLHELLPDQEDRGFRLLPEPDVGDVWFDMEGHPFYETARGLEYLFGYCFRNDAGEVVYDAVWGRDRDGERVAFEQFVDWVVARRAANPGMHVYHYASYERSALTRLMGQHGTREQEVDDFLRQEVLVDLYRVVKQSLRASTSSYSIKEIEKLYGFERTAEVSGGDDSVVRFEEWVETGDDSILEEVERYNEEDCRSTFELHEWLRSIRPAGLPWRLPPDERPRSEEAEERDEEREALKARLLEGAEEGEPRRLLANLVDYHQREQRPEWWAWFRWPQLDDDELIRDRTAIGGLEWDGRPPEVEEQSHVYRMTFPPQEHKISSEGHRPRQRTQGIPGPRRRRHRRRHAPAQRRPRRRAAATRADAGAADRQLGHPRRAASLRARLRGRQRGRLSGARGPARAAPARRAARRRSRHGRALARGELPVRAGTARIGQDLAGRADGDRADARRQARRRHLAQPQGDPQPAPRDPARGRRDRASPSAASSGQERRTTRRPRSRAAASSRRPTRWPSPIPPSISSPARPGR